MGSPDPAAADPCRAERFPLVIDVGHHAGAPGATSARGVAEFAFNQDLAEALLSALHRAGFTSARRLDPDGTLAKLPDRVARLRQLRPALVLSIHHDSVQPQYLETWTWQGEERRYSDRFRGFSLFVSRRNGDFARSRHAAVAIGAALTVAGFRPTLHHAEDIDGERRPLLDAERGVYAGDGLAILAHDGAPAVLIEAGVIVNRDEEAVLAGQPFRRAFAAAVAQGVARACAEAATPRRDGR